MQWYALSMLRIHDLLESHLSIATRCRNAAILLLLVMAVNGVVLYLGIEGTAALVQAGIIDVPTAINMGLLAGAVWVWFFLAKIPYVPVPSLAKAKIAPLAAFAVLGVTLISFASHIPAVPKSPPRFISFAI